MLTVVTNSQRRRVRRGKQEVWHSFGDQDHPGALVAGFGLLVAFDELRLPPGDSTEPHGGGETELVTYILKGSLVQEDTAGNSGVVHAGAFQYTSAGRRTRQRETSASRGEGVHCFRMSLQPWQAHLDGCHEQRSFTVGQRRDALCVVASPDGRKGSLRIHQDALIYSAIFEPGHHLVYDLDTERTVWLHAIYGAATLNGKVLTAGDGIAVSSERAISLTIEQSTEILLVDLGPLRPRPWEKPPRAEDARPQPRAD